MLLKVSMVRIDPTYGHVVNNSGVMARKYPNFRNIVAGAVRHVVCPCKNWFQFFHNVETGFNFSTMWKPVYHTETFIYHCTKEGLEVA
jgi:hypothetical protein